ncbi:FadR/GntR family transcriptional regulator [Nakamurella antarctica]|nr:GntR family transcriptional regulator [Nakamurella antarctica]
MTARTILGSPHGDGGRADQIALQLSRADQIALQLSRAIELGLIPDGTRLPTETVLAEQLGVATVTLREALAVLRYQGLVSTRRGRDGGTFVRAPEANLARSLLNRLRQTSVQELRELGDHRLAISATAAVLATRRAVADEVADLRLRVDRLAAAQGASERRRTDTQITIQIAAAAQSSRLTREESRLQAEIGDLLWLGVSEAEHRLTVASRAALVQAIGAGEESTARTVVEQSISAETARLVRLRMDTYSAPLGEC